MLGRLFTGPLLGDPAPSGLFSTHHPKGFRQNPSQVIPPCSEPSDTPRGLWGATKGSLLLSPSGSRPHPSGLLLLATLSPGALTPASPVCPMSLPTAPCRTAHAHPSSPLLRGPRPLSYLFIVFPSTKPVLPEWVLRSRSGGRPLMWTERVIRHRGPWGLPHPPSLPSPRREPFPRLRSHGSHGPHKWEASGKAALDVPLASLEGKGQLERTPTPLLPCLLTPSPPLPTRPSVQPGLAQQGRGAHPRAPPPASPWAEAK